MSKTNKNLMWLLIIWVFLLLVAIREHSRASFCIIPIFTIIALAYFVYATVFLAKQPEPKDDSQANPPADPKNDNSAK